MEKKSIINVDGRFYYGWVMLICGFIMMFWTLKLSRHGVQNTKLPSLFWKTASTSVDGLWKR